MLSIHPRDPDRSRRAGGRATIDRIGLADARGTPRPIRLRCRPQRTSKRSKGEVMRTLIVAIAMTPAVCLASAAVAFADGAPPTQGVSQSAGTSQIAGAASSAVQVQPTNTNISVRIFSPGNDGNVTQTNSASSTANAGNAAGTSQSADQSQSGSGVQGAQQAASTDQAAIALSEAKQFGASNVSTPARILSPGNG